MSRLALRASQSRSGNVSPTLGETPSFFHHTGCKCGIPRLPKPTVDKDLMRGMSRVSDLPQPLRKSSDPGEALEWLPSPATSHHFVPSSPTMKPTDRSSG